MMSLGVRYMLLSALGFALMAVCVKLAYEDGMPVLEIVAARAGVSLLLSYIDLRRKNLPLLGTNKALLFARGAVGSVALFAVYGAVTLLPLAEATMLQYLHPMFVALLALVFLGERFHAGLVIGLVLSFVGAVLVTGPSFIFDADAREDALSVLGVCLALAGAFGSAVAYVLVRKLSRLEDSSVIILYFPMVALPLSLVLLGGDFVLPNSAETWGLLIGVGIFTQIGQIGLTKAMQTETAARATAFSYVQVVFAVILGAIFFGQWPSMNALIGVALIMVAALLNILLKPTR